MRRVRDLLSTGTGSRVSVRDNFIVIFRDTEIQFHIQHMYISILRRFKANLAKYKIVSYKSDSIKGSV